MGGIKNAYKMLARRCEQKELGIILKWTYRNRVAGWLRTGTGSRLL
jgi:hypothetical protein